MMKINLLKKTSPPQSHISITCFFLYVAVATILVWAMHYIMYSVPPTVLTGAVFTVGETVYVEQLVRGNRATTFHYRVSLDGETWNHKLPPMSCNEVGAVLVWVKRSDDSLPVETLIIVQDPLDICGINSGP